MGGPKCLEPKMPAPAIEAARSIASRCLALQSLEVVVSLNSLPLRLSISHGEPIIVHELQPEGGHFSHFSPAPLSARFQHLFAQILATKTGADRLHVRTKSRTNEKSIRNQFQESPATGSPSPCCVYFDTRRRPRRAPTGPTGTHETPTASQPAAICEQLFFM